MSPACNPDFRNNLPISAVILTLIMLLSPFFNITTESEENIESPLLQTIDEPSRFFSQITNQSKDNLEVGGYHKATNVWWEPTNPFIPTADDPDADGINSSIDSYPWNPHQPLSNQQDCSVDCKADSVFSISDNGEILSYSEDYITYSNIIDGALGDLDNDGDLDLIIAAGQYVEFSENVKGEFQSPMETSRWVYTKSSGFNVGSPQRVHATDLDADGDLDVVVGGDTGVGIIEMDGFDIVSKTELINSSNNDGSGDWSGLSIGDVNNDGLPDLAVSSTYMSTTIRERINVFTNQYQGSGISFSKTWSRDVALAQAIELADIDDDGYDDLIYSAVQVNAIGDGQYFQDIYFHQSDSNGPSTEPFADWSYDGSGSSIGYIMGIEAGDLNNDGDLDLLISASYTSFFLFNDGTGGLDVFPETYSSSNAYTLEICDQSNHVCQVEIPVDAIVDINKDGLNDVLWGNEILLNEGTTDSGSTNIFEELKEVEGDLLLTGDLTGNAVHDIVSITIGGPIAIFNQGGAILDNVVGGTLFSPGAPVQASNSVGTVADVNNDGHPDIITASVLNRIGIHLNDGTGAFSQSPQTVLTTSNYPSSIEVGDINNDGLKDIVIGSGQALEIFWANSTSFFNNTNMNTIETPGGSQYSWYDSILIDDFDDDGKLEIAFEVLDNADTTTGNVARIIEYNENTDSFGLAWTSAAVNDYASDSLEFIDLNEDGDKEFIRCMASTIEIYNSSGAYFTSTPWIVNSTGKGCLFFDATLDGTLDMLSINGDDISVYLGPNFEYVVLSKSVYAAKTFDLHDIDQDGNVELVVGTSSNKKMRVHNIDTTGIVGLIWEAGDYEDNRDFRIADFDGDGSSDILQMNFASQWDIIFGVQDTDYDTIPDRDDNYIFDPTQTTDSDDDGFGDNLNGRLSDNCPYYWGDSVEDRRGCPDQDGDGWSDLGDDFWRESTQWKDTDGDGFGDNYDGSSSRTEHWPGEFVQDAYNPDPSPLDFDNDGFEDEGLSPVGVDDCPKDMGWSFEDRFGCLDTDWDGWSNNDEDWTQGDIFPNDFSQHNDTDGDGFGDNANGTQGDDCPNEFGKSHRDRYGCHDNDRDGWSETSDFDDEDASKWGIDSDGDGVSDENDVFPDDASQSHDIDGDGYGDSSASENGDDCPNAAGNSYLDRIGCVDTDEDGVSDQGDQCPNIPGWSSTPWAGCPDSDGDGTADIIDAFPEDSEEDRDRDNDGIGDNSDSCVNKVTNETSDCTEDRDNDGFNDSVDIFPTDSSEWSDSDGDGTGDNSDVWPLDSDIWSDADGDDWADQFGHILTDDCPSLPGTSSIFMNGCSDLDEDGMPDILDPDIDGDMITNDNEMDASTKTTTFDPFDPNSTPQDIDGDFIPDVLDHDRDGDGFPDELERERGSDYKDGNKTPFNKYGDQDTGLFYVPGEGFKSQYDPEGVEISVSVVIDLITSELLVPLAMIPITVFALMRKRRRYKKMRNRLEDCKDVDMLKEYEEDIDDLVVHRKVKVEHGMLLRNMFERMRDQFEDQEQVRLLGGKGASGSGGMGRSGGQQSGPQLPQRDGMQGQHSGNSGGGGPRRPGGRGGDAGGRY